MQRSATLSGHAQLKRDEGNASALIGYTCTRQRSCLSSSLTFYIQLNVFSLTLHRYGQCLPVLSGHGGSTYGDHTLPSCNGCDEAGLVGLGHISRYLVGGAGGTFGCDSRLAVLPLDKQAAAEWTDRWRAVAVQQCGGRGGHAWRGDG